MKTFFGALLALSFLIAAPAQARRPPPAVLAQQSEPSEGELQSHKHYTNKAGQAVHSPARSKSGKVPAGASAKCRDASYSFSKNHRGTCSHHGGVERWL
jgi:hypothetical protein